MTGGNVFTSVTSLCRLLRRDDLFVLAAGGRGAKLRASNSSFHHLCSRHSELPPRAATECQRSIRQPVNAKFHFLSLWLFFSLSFLFFFTLARVQLWHGKPAMFQPFKVTEGCIYFTLCSVPCWVVVPDFRGKVQSVYCWVEERFFRYQLGNNEGKTKINGMNQGKMNEMDPALAIMEDNWQCFSKDPIGTFPKPGFQVFNKSRENCNIWEKNKQDKVEPKLGGVNSGWQWMWMKSQEDESNSHPAASQGLNVAIENKIKRGRCAETNTGRIMASLHVLEVLSFLSLLFFFLSEVF